MIMKIIVTASGTVPEYGFVTFPTRISIQTIQITHIPTSLLQSLILLFITTIICNKSDSWLFSMVVSVNFCPRLTSIPIQTPPFPSPSHDHFFDFSITYPLILSN